MFSPLARGYGTWTGEINLRTENELQDISEEGSETHRHGVTVSPRVFRSNTNYSFSSRKDDGQVDLPKTYITKKGALLLFTAPPEVTAEKTKQTAKLLHRQKVENLLDCSLKLNTLERLYLSALQYGDLSCYEKDKRSITDPENQLFLKFLHGIDGHDIDSSTQPGGELDIYLRDLKTRASYRLFGSADSLSRKQSDELRDLLQELDGVWKSKSQSSLKKESSSLSQRHSGKGTRILSSKSLTASLKSSTYLGRSDSPATSTGGADSVSPVIFPDITTKTTKKSRRQSWVAPVTPYEQILQPEKATSRAITRVLRGKKQQTLSAKSASDGRQSLHSRSSQLSSSTMELDEKRSSSSRSSDIKEGHDEMAVDDSSEEKDDAIISQSASYTNIASDDTIVEDVGSKLMGDVQSLVSVDKVVIKDAQEGDNLTLKVSELEENNLIANQDVHIQMEGIVGASNDAHIIDESKQGLLDETLINRDMEEKASVASSVLEEQDILLPSDGEETVLEFSEQPEEWPSTIPQLEVTVKIIDDDQDKYTEGDTGKEVCGDERREADDKPESYHKEQHAPRPPSEAQSTQNRRSRLSGRLSAMSRGSTESDKLGKAGTDSSEVKNVTGEDVPPEKLHETEENEEKDDVSYLGMNQDGTESEKSMSFVFIQDNSTSDSASVGKRNMEEDLIELERRRRRNKLLYGFRNSIYDDDDEDDNFEAKAKEAKEKEMEFIRIVEVDSDTEAPKEEETKDVQEKENSKKSVKKQGEKVYVKALEITSIALPVEDVQEPEETVDEEEEEEDDDKPWVHPNQQFFPDGPLPKFVVPDEEAALPSHLEEMLNRRSASKSAEELESELRQMQDILNNEMAGPSMTIDEGEVGLTEEELKLAQEVLQDRVNEVSSKIFNTGETEAEKEEQPEKKTDVKSKKKSGRSKKSGKSKKKVKKELEHQPVDRKKSVAEERDTIRQQRKLEKQRRLEEMKELQEKILARQEERKRQEDEARQKAEELANEQESLKEQAAAIQRDEEEAREQLAAIRNAQRQERDARRKAEQERRRQLAIARRQKEKEMRDKAREKELEMLRRLGDAEDVRQLIEEEEKKQEEEDRISQENFEEEMREQQALLEEEEMRARELEKEAEEEALQRLVLEREAAERRQRELREEEERLRKEEELLRQNMLLEEERLREEQRLKELEEQEKIEQEKLRLEELKKLEEEARLNMREELEYKKEWALKRRELNLERRSHLDKLGYGQGLTRPWVFSYFPLCPSVSYNRSVDKDPLSKKGIQVRLKPSVTIEESEQPTVDPPVTEFMPGLTAIVEE